MERISSRDLRDILLGKKASPIKKTPAHHVQLLADVKQAEVSCPMCRSVIKQTYWPSHLLNSHAITLEQFLSRFYTPHSDLK